MNKTKVPKKVQKKLPNTKKASSKTPKTCKEGDFLQLVLDGSVRVENYENGILADSAEIDGKTILGCVEYVLRAALKILDTTKP